MKHELFRQYFPYNDAAIKTMKNESPTLVQIFTHDTYIAICRIYK